ncbi:LysR family transcriptional regulator [Rhizobium sp. P28RR-XV]|uniref:LysR family transcriptional regulator n=1 Tax=Rhizobium sp. P28RR-XV TaxID=2726737 RepID=UPI001456E23D|nr:LysR family transcriptional regulator [Rhizobium sp. P28RR-XV]NLR88435.1 LysR family transcriptional regulator [Rhizobium sp. P28RR-XV]
MDRLTSVAVFGHVVECGGFSAAARRLNMSATMVGNHVQFLEKRLDVRLLNRTTRKVSLTESGKYYYERSSQILDDLDEADSVVAALTTTPRGTLRLYANTHLTPFLAPVVSEYLGIYPLVTIDLRTGERAVDMVEEGYDLVIRTLSLHDDNLITRRLTPWRHILVCSPEYLENHPVPRAPADLAGHNCLRYTYYPYGDNWHFLDPHGERVSVKIGGNVVTTSGETLRHMVLKGQGICLAAGFVVSDELEAGKFVCLLPQYKPLEFSISAAYPNRAHLTTKTRLFIDLLAERFAVHRQTI